MNEKTLFGIYFVENKDQDQILEIHSISKLPKLVYYNNDSDKFKYSDYNFETYDKFIDKLKDLTN